MNKDIFRFSIRDMVEIALMVGISIILDTFVKFPIGSSGGSLNFAMVPLFIVALRHGPFKGFVAGGLLFGLITCLIDGYGLNTYPLEYMLAFGYAGILGFFSPFIYKRYGKDKTGTVLSYIFVLLTIGFWLVIRVLGGTFDSMLFWEYEFKPALIYNITYALPSMIGVNVLVLAALMTITYINRLKPSNYLKFYI